MLKHPFALLEFIFKTTLLSRLMDSVRPAVKKHLLVQKNVFHDGGSGGHKCNNEALGCYSVEVEGC